MHAVHALLLVNFTHILQGLPVKQPWRILVNESHDFIMNYDDDKTKLDAYLMGYSVGLGILTELV